jgi:hypothetical protein
MGNPQLFTPRLTLATNEDYDGNVEPDANYNIERLDFLADPVYVIDRISDPPGSPSDGDTYIVLIGTGAWLGHDDELAYWWAEESKWLFQAPDYGFLTRNDKGGGVQRYYYWRSFWTDWI